MGRDHRKVCVCASLCIPSLLTVHQIPIHYRQLPEITTTALMFIRGSHNTVLSHSVKYFFIASCQVLFGYCQSNNRSRNVRSGLCRKRSSGVTFGCVCKACAWHEAMLAGFWNWMEELSSYPITFNGTAGCLASSSMAGF